jgi:hypothetical protein
MSQVANNGMRLPGFGTEADTGREATVAPLSSHDPAAETKRPAWTGN